MFEFGEPSLSKTDLKRAKKKGYVEGRKRKPTKAELRKKAASRRKTKKMGKRVYRKFI